MKLDALQTKLVTLLTAAFPNDLVVADWCRKDTEASQEAALAGRGVCIAVSPLLKAPVINGDGGPSSALRAHVVARLRTNPVNNGKPTGANLDIITGIQTAIHAVLADRTGPKRFALATDGDAVVLAPEEKDTGLLSYDITFTYVVQV